MQGVFTAKEAQVNEEDEFVDEYAFNNDCLLNGVDEIIYSKHPRSSRSVKKKAGYVSRKLLKKKKGKKMLCLWKDQNGMKLKIFSKRKS